MRYPASFLQFTEKFNAGEYYECHDLLEEIWMENKSDKFLQGLLQLAVGLYHLEYGNVKGAREMLGSARKYLSRYEPLHGGLDVEQIIRYIQSCEVILPESDTIPLAEAKALSVPTFHMRLKM
jgi:predicted metal-dependent hydrolase